MAGPPWFDPDCISVVGIDPGQVHTGIVYMNLMPNLRRWNMNYMVIDGLDIDRIMDAVNPSRADAVFIEGYRPRSHFSGDAEMIAAVSQLRKKLWNASVLDNTGVKKVITMDLMKLLGVWKFPFTTHHQDLRSAARIGLLGLVKNDGWNSILAQLVQDHIDGKDWAYA